MKKKQDEKQPFQLIKTHCFSFFLLLGPVLLSNFLGKKKCLIVDPDKLVYSTLYRRNCDCPLNQESCSAFLLPEALN
jgi:hypothetical protein